MGDLSSNFFRVLYKVLSFIGGAALSLMMFLTVADVIMRALGYPILGTYEMVALALAVVIGFTIPMVSLDRGHVYMEILLEKLSKRPRAIMNTLTRVFCLILFMVIGYNLIMVGVELHASGEVSSTLKIPFFPIAYGVGICCFLECLVFIFDIVKIWRGQYE
ncbi:MAG TPA: TRAP transporter small permease [Syntrophorhabdaceae bacterium]|nr:TRAP transporter small permease [Syntrophorhabdaceae bacterium]